MKARTLWLALSALALFALLAALPACESDTCARNHRLILRAQERISARQYVAAARDLEAAYATDPRPSLLLRIALTHDRGGDRARAVNAYRHYLEVDAPESEAVRAHLANLAKERLTTEEAAADDKLVSRIETRTEHARDGCAE